MRNEVKKTLFDIITAARNIEEYTVGLDYSNFIENGMIQAAVERKFQIIGEALNRIKQYDDAILLNISEYQSIIAFRNILVHGYDVIDSEIVWDVIKNHLPKLIEEIETLINL